MSVRVVEIRKLLSLPALTTAAIVIGLWCYFFWPVATGNHVLAYRDTASFYYPLFEWIDNSWESGEVPFWNHQEDLGRPVIADPTASVFYPGKLIFFLRFLDFPTRFGIFVCGHVLLAAAGAYWAAGVFKCNQAGAALAAVAFAFGAPVLFQTCNVIYLVGASLLPWAIGCLWLMRETGKKKWMIATCVIASLMILGGDPQMAYHVGLFALVMIVLCRPKDDAAEQVAMASWMWKRRIVSLVSMAIVVGALAAVQILPSYSWSQNSFRKATEVPRSIYEIPQNIVVEGNDVAAISTGIIGQPQSNTHHDHIYQFSLPPWMLIEAIWPNSSGRMFPKYRRWTDGLPGADMTWVPSVFCGSIVFVLACTQFRLRRRHDSQSRFLSWLLICSCIGSFGWYGIGWILDEVSMLVFGARGPPLGHPVGGLYWLMCTVLPGYVSFRYPAKLTVIMAFALVMLAARGLTLIEADTTIKRCRRIVAALVGISLLLLVASLFGNEAMERWMGRVPDDPVFGAPDALASLWDIRISLIHAIVVSLLLTWFVNRLLRSPRSNVFGWLIVAVAALELGIAVKWMVPTVDTEVVQRSIDFRGDVDRLLRLDPPMEERDLTISVEEPDSPMAHWLNWKRQSLYPKHHLETPIELVGSYSSIEPLDWVSWIETGGIELEEAARAMAIEGTVDSKDVTWLEDSLPPTRLVYEYQALPPINNRSIQETRDQTFTTMNYVVDTKGNGVVVETNEELLLGELSADDELETTVIGLSELAFNKNSRDPCLLVLARYYSKDWKAEIKLADETDWMHVESYRANRVMTAVALPAGEVSVRLVYRPWSFYIGAMISAVGWLVLLVGWFAGVGFRLRRSG